MRVTPEEMDCLQAALDNFSVSTCSAGHGRAVELLRQLVKDECSEFQPDWASAPGETLAEIAETEGWSSIDLAKRLNTSVETANYLLSGRLTIDEDMAKRLAGIRGSEAFWFERERTYRRDLARLDPAYFRIGVAALLRRDDRVLMHQRKGSHGAGTWSFPGGHIDARESPRFAICREVREETGLQIPAFDFQPGPYTVDVFEAEGKRYITLYLEADCPLKIGEPRVMEPEKCVEWRWVKPGDWPGELFLPIRNLLSQGFLF